MKGKMKGKIRIVGDGEPQGTRVYYMHHGEEIEISDSLCGVEIIHKAGTGPRAVLTVPWPSIREFTMNIEKFEIE